VHQSTYANTIRCCHKYSSLLKQFHKFRLWCDGLKNNPDALVARGKFRLAGFPGNDVAAVDFLVFAVGGKKFIRRAFLAETLGSRSQCSGVAAIPHEGKSLDNGVNGPMMTQVDWTKNMTAHPSLASRQEGVRRQLWRSLHGNV
jgi:hypothetical protein